MAVELIHVEHHTITLAMSQQKNQRYTDTKDITKDLSK